MEEIKSMGLKRSEVLKIEAAIVEIVEDAGFAIGNDTFLKASGKPGYFMIQFKKDKTPLRDLSFIHEKLGSIIDVTISPCDKTAIYVTLEAPEEAFKKILTDIF